MTHCNTIFSQTLKLVSKHEVETDRKGIFFVTRLKTNAQYRVINCRPVLKNKSLTSDQTIRLTSIQAARKCPSQLRLCFESERDSSDVA